MKYLLFGALLMMKIENAISMTVAPEQKATTKSAQVSVKPILAQVPLDTKTNTSGTTINAPTLVPTINAPTPVPTIKPSIPIATTTSPVIVSSIGTYSALKAQVSKPTQLRTIEYINQPKNLVSAVSQSMLILNPKKDYNDFSSILKYVDEEVLSQLPPSEAAIRSREVMIEVLKKPVDHITLSHFEHLLFRSVEYHSKANLKSDFDLFLNFIAKSYPHHFNYIAENLEVLPPSTVINLQVRKVASEPFIQGSR